MEKVGFFPTINGPFHIGHAWCYVAAGMLAKKMDADLHLNCAVAGGVTAPFVARQVGLLTSLILPDEIVYSVSGDPRKWGRLENGEFLEEETKAIKARLTSGDYEVLVDNMPEPGLLPLDGCENQRFMIWREPGGAWYQALWSPWEGTIDEPDKFLISGIPGEYFLQRRFGVTVSIDGMDIARTMLPHWRALAGMLGENGLYWDARFIANLTDSETKQRIHNSWGDPARLAYWELGRWIDRYEPLGVVRLLWSWMQNAREAPETLKELVAQFDEAKVPWSRNDEPLEIQLEANRAQWLNLMPNMGRPWPWGEKRIP